ncbi:hypothetical protein [Bradyrhizobium canariense]|uniref:hypothetical protein n=2 Tax=Bradyrhizobium TaxID=374 RepID=UPI004063A5D4
MRKTLSPRAAIRKPISDAYPPMLVGYMRVSSDSDRQSTDSQRDALLAAGVDLVTGLGFATTTTMVFRKADRGPALIFDANVINAIVDPSGPWEAHFQEQDPFSAQRTSMRKAC